jgi:hypothetical protein
MTVGFSGGKERKEGKEGGRNRGREKRKEGSKGKKKKEGRKKERKKKKKKVLLESSYRSPSKTRTQGPTPPPVHTSIQFNKQLICP